MANAYKCDRCGEVYPEKTYYCEARLYNKDLCPRCQSQLDAWFADPNKAVVSFVETGDDEYIAPRDSLLRKCDALIKLFGQNEESK